MLTTVFASHKIRSRREILPVFTIIFARNIFNARFTFSQLISSPPLSRGRSRDLDLLGGAGRFTPAYAGNTKACPPYALLPRFTPAYAGNTRSKQSREIRTWVHPRIRGEYKKDWKHNFFLTGSPPHTRGIPSRCRIAVPGRRFTPAYAGNTTGEYVTNPCRWVHPRIRGEYPETPYWRVQSGGSPPHTRGILPPLRCNTC